METEEFASEEEFLAVAEEAALDGDRAVEVNAVRSALANRDFRTMWLSTLGSLIGTWMQNVILAAFVYATTKSALLASLVAFCNLLPQLLFATLGGVLADLFDRKRQIFWLSLEQLLGSLAIAWIVHSPNFSRPALFAAVFAVGIGAALVGPAQLAVIPALVPAKDLSGAVSLNSVSLNISRVIGPAIGAVLYVWVGASWVFLLNAATYLILMVGIAYVRFPPFERRHAESLADRLFGGFTYVRTDPVVWRALATVFLFGMFCSPFMVLFPAIASVDWGVSSHSTMYGLLYANYGLGAIAGSLSISTFLADFEIERVLRVALVGFGVFLALFGTIESAWLAFPVGFVLGFFHFTLITSTSTVFQGRLDHAIRGRVSAVWMMFAVGTVPVSGLLAGWIVGLSSVNTVVYFGAGFAFVLAWYANLRPPKLPA
jgi:MFS family permease